MVDIMYVSMIYGSTTYCMVLSFYLSIFLSFGMEDTLVSQTGFNKKTADQL